MAHSLRVRLKNLNYKGLLTDRELNRLVNALNTVDAVEDIKAEIKEKSNNEIKVGDEVYCEKYGVGAVISIFSYVSIDILTKNNGVFIDIPISGFKKTGRHFYQIAEVLEQMKG